LGGTTEGAGEGEIGWKRSAAFGAYRRNREDAFEMEL
jgi:hypothetical protein